MENIDSNRLKNIVKRSEDFWQCSCGRINPNNTNNCMGCVTNLGDLPHFSVDYFCYLGFDALKLNNYLLAFSCFEEAKKYNPNYSQIYRGLLFLEHRINSEQQIEEWDESYYDSINFKKFFELSNFDEKSLLISRIQKINYEKKKKIYEKACEVLSM